MLIWNTIRKILVQVWTHRVKSEWWLATFNSTLKLPLWVSLISKEGFKKKMTKSWLKIEDGEFQTNQEPFICKKKRKKNKINKICPLHKNGWHGNEMDFLPLTITQTFTTSDSIFWGGESIYVHKHYINSEWCPGSDNSKINFRGNTKTLLMWNPS